MKLILLLLMGAFLCSCANMGFKISKINDDSSCLSPRVLAEDSVIVNRSIEFDNSNYVECAVYKYQGRSAKADEVVAKVRKNAAKNGYGAATMKIDYSTKTETSMQNVCTTSGAGPGSTTSCSTQTKTETIVIFDANGKLYRRR